MDIKMDTINNHIIQEANHNINNNIICTINHINYLNKKCKLINVINNLYIKLQYKYNNSSKNKNNKLKWNLQKRVNKVKVIKKH